MGTLATRILLDGSLIDKVIDLRVSLGYLAGDRRELFGRGRKLRRRGVRFLPVVFEFDQIEGQIDEVGDERILVAVELEVTLQDLLDLLARQFAPDLGGGGLAGHARDSNPQ